MHERCSNAKHFAFKDYGGRGIRVCESWREFEAFMSDMGVRPDGMTLGRIDNEKGYEPGNCRWETQKSQARNRRNSKLIEYGGAVKTAAEWAEIAGITQCLLHVRMKLGWSIEKTLSTPPREQRNSVHKRRGV